MTVHSDLSGAELHDPKGKSPTPLVLDLNTADAYRIEDSAGDALFKINTTTGAVALTFSQGTVVVEGAGGVQSSGPVDILAYPLVLRKMTDNPSGVASQGKLYTKAISGVTELFFVDSAGGVTQLTSGGLALPHFSTAPADGDTLVFDSDTGLWVPTSPDPWMVVEEVQLHSLSNQTLGSDGAVTVDSKSYTKFNSSGESAAMAIVAGTGLRVQPAAATNIDGADYSAPGLRRLLATVYPELTPFTPVRASFRMAANTTANYHGGLAWLESGPAAGEMRLIAGQLYVGASKLYVASRLGGSLSGEVLAAYGSETCWRLEAPHGLSGGYARLYAGSAALGAWPTSWTLVGVTKSKLSTSPIDPAALSMCLGGFRAGSGTALVVDFSGYKIEVA